MYLDIYVYIYICIYVYMYIYTSKKMKKNVVGIACMKMKNLTNTFL